MKKLVIGLVILIVALIIYFITPTNTNDDKMMSNSEDMYNCSKDSDCIVVDLGWCGFLVSINKDWEKVWREKNEQERVENAGAICEILAPWEKLEYAIPVCHEGMCVVTYDEDIVNQYK